MCVFYHGVYFAFKANTFSRAEASVQFFFNSLEKKVTTILFLFILHLFLLWSSLLLYTWLVYYWHIVHARTWTRNKVNVKVKMKKGMMAWYAFYLFLSDFEDAIQVKREKADMHGWVAYVAWKWNKKAAPSPSTLLV